jgi:hypothetical protein
MCNDDSGSILHCIFSALLHYALNDFLSARFWANSSAAQWRVPVALQIVFALVMIIAIGFVRLLVYVQWPLLSNHDLFDKTFLAS